MTDLYDSQITQILPPALAESEKVQAVSYAISNQIKKLIDYAATTSVYALIDTASEEIVNLLAAELCTQYYDVSLDLDAKRALVKNTLIWYETVGTPSAVAELIAIVFGVGELVEWYDFEDGEGDPYTFDIVTNAQLTEEILETLAAMIKKVKNTRSHLRWVFIARGLTMTEMYAANAVAEPYVPITNSPQKTSDVPISESMAVAALAYPTIFITNG